jgi:hypothetical protein
MAAEPQLGVLAIALRELVHGALGWLASEPRIDVKRTLGAHAYDDARSLVKLHRRAGDPGGPDEQLREALEPLRLATTAAEFEAAAYGEIKPAAWALAASTAQRLDPLADEPELRILLQLAHRQERHVGELPIRHPHPPPPQFGAAVADARHELFTVPRPATPARDPYVEIALGAPAGAHSAIHAALLAAERAARVAHERPSSIDDLADAARVVHDHLRQAAVLERDYAGQWGDEPVELVQL